MTFISIGSSDEIFEGQCKGFVIGEREIAVTRSEGKLSAISNRCTHAGSRLEGGRIQNGWIACPLHGARFDLATGQCINSKLGYPPLRCYAVRERDGIVEIDLTDLLRGRE